jgi:hypothetical protein
VITTIFKPTALIRTLAGAANGCTVVVADAKSLPETEYMAGLATARCFVYLTVEKQLALGYAIVPLIPLNTFARKNIGYIYAMSHGAVQIYDTDDDNEITDMALLENWLSGARWTTTASNPYPAFGVANMIWPRGLPLDLVKDAAYTGNAPPPPPAACHFVQSLANEEPDVDAIYRLTSPHYPVSFHTPAHTLSYTPGLAPFNAQATLFVNRESFEHMLLPATVHGRVSDIWRSYLAQSTSRRCQLLFSSPWVTQRRNAHNYLADFESEIPLYTQASALVAFLSRRSYASPLAAMTDMYEHGVVERADVHLAQAWAADVRRALAITSPAVRKQRRHLVIMMGQVRQLRAWIPRLQALPHVDMLLGTYDAPFEQSGVETHFVGGTTWTTGRNALVQKAFQRERRLGVRYDYWTVADADIIIRCRHVLHGPLTADETCFERYDAFLWRANMPMFSLHGEGMIDTNQDPATVMVRQEAFDAAWNTFHRDAVPLLFPYYGDLDSVTWW